MGEVMAIRYISGDDAYLIERTAKEAFEQLSEGLDLTFACSVISGEASTVSDVERAMVQTIEAIATVSLFGKRVVWLRGVSFLGDSVVGRAKGTLSALEGLQAALEAHDIETVDVLISAYPVDRRRSFAKWLEKKADVCTRLSFKSESEVQAWTQEQARAQGLELTQDQVYALVSQVGLDAGALHSEVQKLSTYAGEGTTTLTDAQLQPLVMGLGQGDFFEPVERFYCTDSDRVSQTLAAVDRYFFHNKEARPLLFALQNRNRLMIQLKALKDAGALPTVSKASLEKAAGIYGEAVADLQDKSNCNIFSQNPWYLSRLAPSLSAFSLKQLLDFQSHLLEAFRGIVASPQGQRDVVKRLVTQFI